MTVTRQQQDTIEKGETERSIRGFEQGRRGGTEGSIDFGGFGVRWMIDGIDTGERFAIVHYRIAPRALAAPLHFHYNEDEYSYVLTGTLGAVLGDEVVTAEAGSWLFKPRRQWHTFWNAGDAPCEIIEVISPAGFENYFREVAAAWGDLASFDQINRVLARHALRKRAGALSTVRPHLS